MKRQKEAQERRAVAMQATAARAARAASAAGASNAPSASDDQLAGTSTLFDAERRKVRRVELLPSSASAAAAQLGAPLAPAPAPSQQRVLGAVVQPTAAHDVSCPCIYCPRVPRQPPPPVMQPTPEQAQQVLASYEQTIGNSMQQVQQQLQRQLQQQQTQQMLLHLQQAAQAQQLQHPRRLELPQQRVISAAPPPPDAQQALQSLHATQLQMLQQQQ
ncbi:hypothetical protein PFISCL1PPCAC_18617, partial [Pristionchus fissidentatus]